MRRWSLLLCALALDAAAFAQLPVEAHRNQQELLASDDPTLAANKKLVYDFWREVLQAHRLDRAPEYLAEDYIQHNPNVATGRAAFVEFFAQLRVADGKIVEHWDYGTKE
jgi:predicted SnoaL-like aldol condensation-catalyzing enzyme